MRTPVIRGAVLALVLLAAAPAALADDLPSVDEVVFPAPEQVVFTVESQDGASAIEESADATVTTLSGDVNFDVDSDVLTARAKEVLDALSASWAAAKPGAVTITGHTDSVADDAHNLDLSRRRARAVGDYLASKATGLDLVTDGRGEAEPIADNSTDEGRAENRRVEIRAEKAGE